MHEIIAAIAWSFMLGATFAFVLLGELRSRPICTTPQRRVTTILVKLCAGIVVTLCGVLAVINFAEHNVLWVETYVALGETYVISAVLLLRDDSWLYRHCKRLKNRRTAIRRAHLRSSTTT